MKSKLLAIIAITFLSAPLSSAVSDADIAGIFLNLTPSTPYYAHYMHEDAASNQFTVASSDPPFVTAAAPIFDGFFTDGVWTETFDFGQECDTGGGIGTLCRTLVLAEDRPGPGWSGTGGTEAVTAANNSNGDGGGGARFYVGDGKNSGPSPKLTIKFPQREPEIWIRWYMRFESGFAWSGGGGPSYDKFIYMWSHGPGRGGFALIPGYDGGELKIWVGGPSHPDVGTGLTWTDVFSNPGDGLFHMLEVYCKTSSALGAADGILRLWIDGVKEAEDTAVDFSTGQTKRPLEGLDGLKKFQFHHNQHNPSNGGLAYVDYDDIAIYKVTPPNTSPDGDPWIGPLNGYSGPP